MMPLWTSAMRPREPTLQLADLARRLDHPERAAVLDREPGGVVAAVFESLEPLDQDVEALALANVSDDAAHPLQRLLPLPPLPRRRVPLCAVLPRPRVFPPCALPPRARAVSGARSAARAAATSSRVRAADGDSAITRTTGSVPEGRTWS